MPPTRHSVVPHIVLLEVSLALCLILLDKLCRNIKTATMTMIETTIISRYSNAV